MGSRCGMIVIILGLSRLDLEAPWGFDLVRSDRGLF